MQGPFLAIFAMELGQRNANIIFLLKNNSLCGFTVPFQIFKNWLKRISALTAYVCGAAPCSALPTADENAVTESAVTTVSSSLFPVGSYEERVLILLSLAFWNLQATRVLNFLSGDGVITAVLKGDQTYILL